MGGLMKHLFTLKIQFFMALLCVASSMAHARSVTIVNNTGVDGIFYLEMQNPNTIPGNVIIEYAKLPNPCIFNTNIYAGYGNLETCYMSLPSGQSQALSLDEFGDGQLEYAVTGGGILHYPQGNCNTTLAEITTYSDGNNDAYDISLVNGQNLNVTITSSNGAEIVLNTNSLSEILQITGVYPPGCDICTGSQSPPTWAGNGGTTQNCPAYGQPNNQMPAGSCKAGTQYNPTVPCQMTSQPASDNYTITFSPI
jgi:hypothetical protein